MKKNVVYAFIFDWMYCLNPLSAQEKGLETTPWCPDLGSGKYKNPIIYADYSDPDAIRVGCDYYLVSSGFSNFPGLPILHSKDLVNWSIIGHAVQNYPFIEFEKPQHGNAIWVPSIMYHNNEFYVYFGDPDRSTFFMMEYFC